MAHGSKERCGQPATCLEYGMARCDAHRIDLSPCVWENNLDQDGRCRIDHARLARIYGPTCANPATGG
jgi:hypothetical protein